MTRRRLVAGVALVAAVVVLVWRLEGTGDDGFAVRDAVLDDTTLSFEVTANRDPARPGTWTFQASVRASNLGDREAVLLVGPCGAAPVFDVPDPGRIGTPRSGLVGELKGGVRTPVVRDVSRSVGARAPRLRVPFGAVESPGGAPCAEGSGSATEPVPLAAGATVERSWGIVLGAADVAWVLDGAQVGLDVALSNVADPSGTRRPPGSSAVPLRIALRELVGPTVPSGPLAPVTAADLVLSDPRTEARLSSAGVTVADAASLLVETDIEGERWVIVVRADGPERVVLMRGSVSPEGSPGSVTVA